MDPTLENLFSLHSAHQRAGRILSDKTAKLRAKVNSAHKKHLQELNGVRKMITKGTYTSGNPLIDETILYTECSEATVMKLLKLDTLVRDCPEGYLLILTVRPYWKDNTVWTFKYKFMIGKLEVSTKIQVKASSYEFFGFGFQPYAIRFPTQRFVCTFSKRIRGEKHFTTDTYNETSLVEKFFGNSTPLIVDQEDTIMGIEIIPSKDEVVSRLKELLSTTNRFMEDTAQKRGHLHLLPQSDDVCKEARELISRLP